MDFIYIDLINLPLQMAKMESIDNSTRRGWFMLKIAKTFINLEQNPPTPQATLRSIIESHGGIGKMYKLFDDRTDSSIDQLNRELVA